jgi:hypothetical protein
MYVLATAGKTHWQRKEIYTRNCGENMQATTENTNKQQEEIHTDNSRENMYTGGSREYLLVTAGNTSNCKGDTHMQWQGNTQWQQQGKHTGNGREYTLAI